MSPSQTFLVIQTAFIGDVVLTLPLVQRIQDIFPGASVDFVAIPTTAPVLSNHPALGDIIVYDKRGKDAGVKGITAISSRLRGRRYDVALIPHRSMRSALVAMLSGVPRRIGFSRSAGRLLLTDVVAYDKKTHEIRRNLSLLTPLGACASPLELPNLYPGDEDKVVVDKFLTETLGTTNPDPARTVALAPGSIWNTKMWPKESFAALASMLVRQAIDVVLLGSTSDELLCKEIQRSAGNERIHQVAGRLTLLQSAELLRRCGLLVSNDSAPMHLALAMRTPVVAIFGPTVPEFGFAPLGVNDHILEVKGLPCRPCSIHGGPQCPIRTFECMKMIPPDQVFAVVDRALSKSPPKNGRKNV